MRHLRAAILDLDGVITRTARLHARAWKDMFDEYLEGRTESRRPFDVDADYKTYVDGKPRYDGVKSFLASRGIELPYGDPGDPSGKETICGLGNRKNERFHALLESEGVESFDDTVEQLRKWRTSGVMTAVVSSSRNCVPVLKAAGLEDLFETSVDGVDSDELGLAGKPAPDIFLEAARRLGVEPHEAMVLEDSVAGVKAGREGGFGLVVGVARDAGPDLSRHGADVVVHDVRSLDDRLGSDG